MGTLNIKFNKYWYKHTLATLKWRLEWKLRMSKMPWGKLYRYFWRKKRITEVSKVIEQKTYRPQVIPVPLDMNNFKIHIPYLGTYNGIPVIENPHRLFMMECRESSE